jgi:2-dehydro-3-deoxygalactonokinase
VSGSVAIDWGTSNFRAYRLDADGKLLDERKASAGISTVENGAFEPVLMQQIGDWLKEAPAAPVIMAGMIGSRNGWVEAPYAPLPCSVADLSRRVTRIALSNGGEARIIPGISGIIDGIGDVMRGEETLAMGLDIEDGVVISAGTHPKWIEIARGRIIRFQTFMTGEFFALAAEQSLLSKLAIDPAGTDEMDLGFERGLQAAHQKAGLLRTLFAARSDVLLGRLTGGMVKSYLSGLMIGHEVLGAKASFGLPKSATLVTSDAKIPLYRKALAQHGVRVNTADMDKTLLAGLARIVSHI